MTTEPTQKATEKFFIVKSLTVQDLEASVRNGIWATQSHNEVLLNRAYEEADNVYMIFSANKSGEYFGYVQLATTFRLQSNRYLDTLEWLLKYRANLLT